MKAIITSTLLFFFVGLLVGMNDVVAESLFCQRLFQSATLESESDKEDYLFRIVYGADLKFDSKGYLLPVEVDGEMSGQPVTLPLVHPTEWKTIARMFALPKFRKKNQLAWLLKIKKDKVEKLTNQSHVLLPMHGEFFGVVNRDAIEAILKFGWEYKPELANEGQQLSEWQPILK